MFEVYDNFLDNEDYLEIEKILNNSEFPWYFNPFITDSLEEKTFGQFTHTLYRNNIGVVSDWHNKFTVPIMNRVSNLCSQGSNIFLLSAKLNLNVRKDSHLPQGRHHTDWRIPGPTHKTAIYYCNDNNGFTEFEDGTKIECEPNRLLVFDGSNKHVGYTCTDEQTRVILNINYLVSQKHD